MSTRYTHHDFGKIPLPAWQLIGLSLLVLAIAGIAAVITATPRQALSAGASSAPFAGYLWSDTIGWIDLNCSNTSVCGTKPFGLSLASDGTVSGYAWSDNIGWVSANPSDTSVCGSKAQVSGSAFTGWLRAIAGGTAQSGGWDGCVSLSGAGYGVTKSVNGTLGGYAWGDMNVGWVDFSKAQITPACVAQNMCVSNAYSYQDQFCQVSTIKQCTGSCTPGGCSEDLTPPTGSIKALPNFVANGHTTKIAWSAQDATSCSVSGSNGDGTWTGISGAATSSPITGKVTYTLSCQNGDVSMQEAVDVNIYITPVYHEF